MLKKRYSKKDINELSDQARQDWELDFQAKKIKRKKRASIQKYPIRAIYYMTKKVFSDNENKAQCFPFPFVESRFFDILGLNKGWTISLVDRRYLEKDMVLFADDGKSTLVVPDERPWWDSKWINVLSHVIAFAGVLASVFTLFC